MKKLHCAVILLLILPMLFPGCAKQEKAPIPESSEIETETEQKHFIPVTPGKLTIAVSPDLAPMEFVVAADGSDDILLAGFDISLGEYIASAMELKVTWLPMDFESCLDAVENKTADMAISAVAWTTERQARFRLSDAYVPYKGTADVVVMHADASALAETVNTILAQAEEAGCYAPWYTEAKEKARTGYEVSFDSHGQVIH